jgi:hypothetical protein
MPRTRFAHRMPGVAVIAAATAAIACATAVPASASAATVRPASAGSLSALQNLNTRLCLDDSAQYGLRTYPCNQSSYNGGYQAWQMTSPPD